MEFSLILIFSAAILSFADSAARKSKRDILAEEFYEIILSDPSAITLDVRLPEELTGPLGKIDNALNIPLQALDRRYDELKKYGNKPIYLICRTGRRTETARDFLLEKGFNVFNVIGGMTAYRNFIKRK